MDSAEKDQFLQPGSDHLAQTQQLQNKVSANLAILTGQTTPDNQVVPIIQQPVLEGSLAENSNTEMDLEDLMDGLNGRTRTDPSRNFLKIFLGRLKKKNPDKEVVSN